jgi:DNA repair protein RecO (recombination protein O)
LSLERATGLILRTTDFSETSRIATIWTREFGKVRALAKGGRRLKSAFESGLDLLTLCSMVLLRKSSGSLDLLTEAQVLERFPALRTDLNALYAGYYVAELLGEWTEENDPHPALFEEAVDTLRTLGTGHVPTALRLLRFEIVLLRELGYVPVLTECASCHRPLPAAGPLLVSAAAGGVCCGQCRVPYRGQAPLSQEGLQALRLLADEANWPKAASSVVPELRQVMNVYVCHLLGRKPRTMAYLGEPGA